MRTRSLAAACLLLLATAAWVGSAQGPGGTPACDASFQDVPGQGPSRRQANGLWEVCLRDGSTILTHGPDRGEPGAPGAGGGGGSAPQRAPHCVTGHYRNVVVYAVPSNRADRYATQAATLRTYVANANAQLHNDAQAHGAAIDYRFQCTGSTVDVLRHVLPTHSSQDSFSTIVSDLRAQGLGDRLVKYWVWYDDGVGGYCGQGSIYNDDRRVSSNPSNYGDMFGITYGCDWTTMMHENGHNLGAVQHSAPHASGGWHCNDGQDIMCYADGGSTSNYQHNVCSNLRFDCGFDDYFHPAPAAGSYLATRWNLGSTLNRFLHFGGITAPPSAPQNLVAGDGQKVGAAGFHARWTPVQLTWQAPASLHGGLVQDYQVWRTPPGGQPTLVATLPGESFAYNDYGYTVTGTHTYEVRAANGAGWGTAASDTAEVTVAVV